MESMAYDCECAFACVRACMRACVCIYEAIIKYFVLFLTLIRFNICLLESKLRKMFHYFIVCLFLCLQSLLADLYCFVCKFHCVLSLPPEYAWTYCELSVSPLQVQ